MIKKVKLKLGEIGGKQDPFDEDFEEKMKFALEPHKPKFSRHSTVRENAKIGSFKPKQRKQFAGKTMKKPGEDEPLPQYSVFENISYQEIVQKINQVQKIGNEVQTGKEPRVKSRHELMLDQMAGELKKKVEEKIKIEDEWDREFKMVQDKKKHKKVPLRTI